MRNIMEYPVTKEEVVETLQRIHESYQMDIEYSGRIGDMTPEILRCAIECIEENYGKREDKNTSS